MSGGARDVTSPPPLMFQNVIRCGELAARLVSNICRFRFSQLFALRSATVAGGGFSRRVGARAALRSSPEYRRARTCESA